MADIERLRLFVAVRVPPEHLSKVDDALAPHKDAWPGARWIALENQHVTLKFLGSTPSDRFGAVCDVIRMVAAGHVPSHVSLTRLGVFPSPRRARVLWVGIDDDAALLSRLASDLQSSFEPLGYPSEERPFTPHLTLARFKSPVRVEGSLPASSFEDLSFAVESVDLFRSRLHPKGALYELLEAFPLGRKAHAGEDAVG